jgi:glucose-1-phosphate cytidylyltransferase
MRLTGAAIFRLDNRALGWIAQTDSRHTLLEVVFGRNSRGRCMTYPVAILCGGLGTRLREETEIKPKPMVTIGGRPILWHIMKIYAAHGFTDFILCLGYKGDAIRDYFLNYKMQNVSSRVSLRTGTVEILSEETDIPDWTVTLADTGVDSLTGTRLQKILPYIKGDRFLATYGDGVADVDIPAAIAAHEASAKLATVTAVHPSSRFGELSLTGDVVKGFVEKPQVDQGWINGGFFVLEKKAFLQSPSGNFALETGLLEKLADADELAVHRHNGFWQCMDTFREMQLLNQLWDEGKAKWKVWS